MDDKIKILVVGDPASIHANRFTSLLQEIGYEVRVFQSEHYYWQEEHLSDTTLYVSFADSPATNNNVVKVCIPFTMDGDSFFYKVLRRFQGLYNYCRSRPRELDLVKIVRTWNPDIVFSLKIQNDGYTVAKAKAILGVQFKGKWVHFNWGTDIEFFGKHPDYVDEHVPQIRNLLSQCDYFLADCKRDVRQAQEFGLRGANLGDCLAPGGFDLNVLQAIKVRHADKERDVILVKGREGGLVGKAFNALIALHRVSHLLKNYKVKIVMATPEVKAVSDFLTRMDSIEYEIVARLPYQGLLDLFAQSVIAISASDIDGTPSFLTEAMAMGAFPIHSDMESVREWVQPDVNGLLFSVDDIEALSHCIGKALSDKQLIENAREKNWEIANERMDRQKIKAHLKNLIENVILDKRSFSS